MNEYNKFKSLIDEIDDLIVKGVSSSSPEFVAWKAKAERFLIKKYGNNSYEFQEFRKLRFTLTVFAWSTPDHEFVNACARDLRRVKAVFLTYLEEMKDDEVNDDSYTTVNEFDYSSVFIVHGHNEAIKQSVARLIEKQGIKAVILHEQPNQGATIIEKFEENSQVGAAICLFSADDFGHSKASSEEKPRARQNVVFESGYFMGKLGRERVVIIADKDVELPSDMQGIVYTDSSSWEFEVLKELRAIGYKIDLNKAI